MRNIILFFLFLIVIAGCSGRLVGERGWPTGMGQPGRVVVKNMSFRMAHVYIFNPSYPHPSYPRLVWREGKVIPVGKLYLRRDIGGDKVDVFRLTPGRRYVFLIWWGGRNPIPIPEWGWGCGCSYGYGYHYNYNYNFSSPLFSIPQYRWYWGIEVLVTPEIRGYRVSRFEYFWASAYIVLPRVREPGYRPFFRVYPEIRGRIP